MYRRATRAALCALLVCLTGCGVGRGLWQPEGNGGWSPERRREEIRRAVESGVPVPSGAVEAAAVDAPEVLDLDTLLQRVRAHNLRIAEGRHQVAGAAARVGDVRGRLLPALSGSGRYTWYSDPQSTSVNFPPQLLQQLQIASPPEVRIREAEFGVFNGTLALPIDLSGELFHALRAAQAGYRGEQARQWALALDQETAAMRLYFHVLEAQRLVEVSYQTLVQLRQQLAQTQSKLDNGRVTRNELLVVQVALRNAEQQRLQRVLALDQSRWQLNQLIGRPVDAPTSLAEVHARPRLAPVDELIGRMHEHNPVALSFVEEQQRLEETVTALERSRLPRFTGGGAVDYTTVDLIQPQRIESGFVGMSWDLGTDLRRESQIAEARAAAERNRLALRRLMQELETTLRATHGAAAERLAALETAAAAVAQAEENLRLRQQQFEAGRIESDKVLEAESLLDGQRAAAVNALYQACSRRAELQQIIGLPLTDTFVSEVRP